MAAQIPFGWSVRSRRPIDDRYIVADLTARDALDTFRRHEGLFCYVESNDKTYKLIGGIDNANWVEVLDNIGELSTGTPDGSEDFLTYFDVTDSTHKKVLINDLVSGSKWTDGTFNAGGFGILNGIIRNSYVTIGQASLADLTARSAKLLVKSDYTTTSDANAPSHFMVLTSDNIRALKLHINRMELYENLRLSANNIQTLTGGLTIATPSVSDINFTSRNFGINAGNNQVIDFKFNSVTKVQLQYVNATTTLNFNIQNLPTSDPLVAGQVWNDAGTLKISAG